MKCSYIRINLAVKYYWTKPELKKYKNKKEYSII
jgi:hypothetical protein